jgi:hypothetical protein
MIKKDKSNKIVFKIGSTIQLTSAPVGPSKGVDPANIWPLPGRDFVKQNNPAV